MPDWTEAQHNRDLPDFDFEKVKAEYVSTLFVPEKKQTKQFLLCPVGVVGAGKTTVIKPLSERLDILRISADEIRIILKREGFNYDRAKEMTLALVTHYVKEGYSVAIDANCGSPDPESHMKKLQSDYGLKLFWLRVNPPDSFIVEKLKRYNHTWLFKDAEEAVRGFYEYKERYGDFSDLNLDYTYVFDTSKSNLAAQIDEAEKIIVSHI